MDESPESPELPRLPEFISCPECSTRHSGQHYAIVFGVGWLHCERCETNFTQALVTRTPPVRGESANDT